MYQKLNKLIPFSILLIITLPWLGFRFIFASYYKTEDSYWWYIYSDLGLVLISVLGFSIWHFFFKIKWIEIIWIFVYSVVIVLFIITTIISFFISQVTNDPNFKTALIGIRSVFISPFPFLLLWFFSKKL